MPELSHLPKECRLYLQQYSERFNSPFSDSRIFIVVISPVGVCFEQEKVVAIKIVETINLRIDFGFIVVNLLVIFLISNLYIQQVNCLLRLIIATYSFNFTSIKTGLSFSLRLFASCSSSFFFSGYFGVEFLNSSESTWALSSKALIQETRYSVPSTVTVFWILKFGPLSISLTRPVPLSIKY